MKMKIPHYHFYTSGRYPVQLLICPHCRKRLQRYDIEEFMRCPYCNYAFELNADLEAFMLQPVVNEWMRLIRHHESSPEMQSPL